MVQEWVNTRNRSYVVHLEKLGGFSYLPIEQNKDQSGLKKIVGKGKRKVAEQ